MKYIPNAVSQKVARGALQFSKNSPHLMFAAGVVGIGASVVLACRATLKLDDVLYNTKRDLGEAKKIKEGADAVGAGDYPDIEYKRDLAHIYTKSTLNIAKLYALPAVVGVASIGLVTGSHVQLTRRNVGLTAAYAGIDKAFEEYKARTREMLGEEKERELHYSVEACEIDPETKKEIVTRVTSTTASPYAVMFDHTNPNWKRDPVDNNTFLRAQQAWAQQRLNARGYLFLSDVYDQLGVEQTPESRVVGWLRNGPDGFVDYGLGDWPSASDWAQGSEHAILLDFNVDGTIWDKI